MECLSTHVTSVSSYLFPRNESAFVLFLRLFWSFFFVWSHTQKWTTQLDPSTSVVSKTELVLKCRIQQVLPLVPLYVSCHSLDLLNQVFQELTPQSPLFLFNPTQRNDRFQTISLQTKYHASCSYLLLDKCPYHFIISYPF